jgi:YHS domain-containing protein
MRKILGIIIIALLAAVQAAAQQRQPIIPLEGLDPVLLTQGKQVQGEMNISVTRGGFQYLFANAENKALFEKEPQRYEIQLGGACARMGQPTGGNPDLYTVQNGQIFVFGSEDCKRAFEAAPEKYIERKEAGAPAATPEEVSKGHELIEKALRAMGGAERLDSITSYQEQRASTQSRPSGDVEIKQELTIVFPDRVRQETVTPDWRYSTVLAPGEAFTATPRGARPLTDAARAEAEKQLKRNPLLLLRARKSAGFKAAAAGSGKVGDTAVELVAVQVDNVKLKLGVDAATGHILTASYQGRGPDGTVGEIVRAYSDFRNVDGLVLPFKTEGTFKGQSDPRQTSSVKSIVVNGQIAPAAFEKPKAGGTL